MFDLRHRGRFPRYAGALLAGMLLTGCLLSGSDQDPATEGNRVSWQAGPVLLEAGDFYLEAGGVRFEAATRTMSVGGDPGSSGSNTIELIWLEHGVEMRLFIYFESDMQEWWSDEIRIYNGLDDAEWIYFHGDFFRRPLGMPFEGDIHLTAENEGVSGVLHFAGLRLESFRRIEACEGDEEGLPLDVRTPEIALTTAANTGFAASVYLLDSQCEMIADQSALDYAWRVDDPDIAAVTPAARCLPPIHEPCPEMAADLIGLQPGETMVRVRVTTLYNGMDVLLAEDAMHVTVTP